MGTSVSVAKYMNAPEMDAKKFAANELPPTSMATYRLGMSASCPGRPRRNPATSTPPKSSGMTWSAYPHVDVYQSCRSSRVNHSHEVRSVTAIPAPARIHFRLYTPSQKALDVLGAAQLAKTRKTTMLAM